MEIIRQETNKFNDILSKELFNQQNQISQDIYDFNFAKSKKLRPKLIFLFAKALNKDIDEKLYNLACAAELIHNATLIHDDVIDNADFRRGNLSFNKKFGNNLSVLSGDLLLSVAMKFLAKCENFKCFNYFSTSLTKMCEGEINQHFTINKVPAISEYIEKSQNKTAELYIAALSSLCELLQIKEIKNIQEFAKNFGIAFQIKDDLMNILSTDTSKPVNSDIFNGIYTAPVILLQNENIDLNIFKKEEITTLIHNNPKVLTKTIEIIAKYCQKAIDSIAFIEDNCYKKEILNLTENLYKVNINE